MKRDLWLDGIYFWGAQGGFWQSNAFKEHLDYWTPENKGAYYPRPLWDGRNRQTQTRYLQNGAYCRLKNLTFGYTLPKTITSKAGMQSVRVYMSCENVFTITSLSKILTLRTSVLSMVVQVRPTHCRALYHSDLT